jgi:hypothetical protein
MRVHQSLLDDCLLRMQYKIETKHYYGGSIRALGSAYHKAIENYYVRRQKDGFFLPDDELIGILIGEAAAEFEAICSGDTTSHVSETTRTRAGFTWNKNVPDFQSGLDLLQVMVPAYFEAGVWPEGWEVLGVEQFFELPWTDRHTRGGSIDLILYHPETDTVVGDDQKTAGRAWNKGKEKPRKNIQAPWYSWAIRDLYPGHRWYLSTFSIMTYGGKFERRESNPDPVHIEAAADLLHSTAAMYEVIRANGMDLPANPGSTLCSPEYCDFFEQCPHGSRLD